MEVACKQVIKLNAAEQLLCLLFITTCGLVDWRFAKHAPHAAQVNYVGVIIAKMRATLRIINYA